MRCPRKEKEDFPNHESLIDMISFFFFLLTIKETSKEGVNEACVNTSFSIFFFSPYFLLLLNILNFFYCFMGFSLS